MDPFVLRLSPGRKRNQKVQLLKRPHSEYASHTWEIPHKPTARAIQKNVFDKKERKYGA